MPKLLDPITRLDRSTREVNAAKDAVHRAERDITEAMTRRIKAESRLQRALLDQRDAVVLAPRSAVEVYAREARAS